MEILFIVAVILSPILAALFDYVRETRHEKRTQDDWQHLIQTMRAEWERDRNEAHGCKEQLHVANQLIERLLTLLSAPGVNIINAGAGAVVGQAAAGKDITQNK